MYIRYIFLTFAALLLTGCATPYSVREGAPTAKLRFISADFGDTNLVHVTDGDRQVANTLKAGLFTSSEKSPIQMLGTSPAEETAIRERLIDANALFRFKIGNYVASTQYTRGSSCQLQGEFFPVESAQYELVYENCSARMYKLTANENGSVQKTSIPLASWSNDAY